MELDSPWPFGDEHKVRQVLLNATPSMPLRSHYFENIRWWSFLYELKPPSTPITFSFLEKVAVAFKQLFIVAS